MKKTAEKPSATSPAGAPKEARRTRSDKIHPVIIYPFKQPDQFTDLQALYDLVARLASDPKRYRRPLTVIDRKTDYAETKNGRYLEFRRKTVAQHSEILDAWCVDTCQMWYAGLGQAFEQGQPDDVYWLIPGDFNYGSPVGQDVLSRLHDLPEIILELNQDLCIGEIATDHSNSKQVIDTYGTFALLYNWFPAEAQEIRQFTERPRSEFFAVRHSFLQEVLAERWFPYEQTVVMLLQAVFTQRRFTRFFVGHITDLPEGRESLTAAMQQVERTERVLKALWRQRHQSEPDWLQRYRVLETQSEQVRRTAFTVLASLLT